MAHDREHDAAAVWRPALDRVRAASGLGRDWERGDGPDPELDEMRFEEATGGLVGLWASAGYNTEERRAGYRKKHPALGRAVDELQEAANEAWEILSARTERHGKKPGSPARPKDWSFVARLERTADALDALVNAPPAATTPPGPQPISVTDFRTELLWRLGWSRRYTGKLEQLERAGAIEIEPIPGNPKRPLYEVRIIDWSKLVRKPRNWPPDALPDKV